MAELDVKLQVDGIPTGGFFAALQNFFNVELRKAEADISKRLLYSAREEHRYDHQSRNLRNATKLKGKLTGTEGLILYVDLNKADYAKYIITGHGSWKSDPFITEALETNSAWIQQRIALAVDGAIVKFNRQK
jgi:hypothetical protein